MGRLVRKGLSGSRYAICVKNTGYRASLEVRKVYRVKNDKTGSGHGLIRVVDESGDSYLYPEKFFVPIKLPKTVEKKLGRVR